MTNTDNIELDSVSLVEKSVVEGVGLLTLNRPQKRNAISPEMYRQFNDVMRDHQINPNVNAIMIVSNGEVFCAGGDLNMISHAKSGDIDANELDLDFFTPGVVTKPIICGVNGACVGEGVAMMLASDLVICDQSSRFRLPEIGFGIPPVDIPLLGARKVNPIFMLDLLLTGEWKDANWAEKVGLVNEIVSDEELRGATFRLAKKIASAPREIAALVKSLTYSIRTPGNADAIRQYGAGVRAEIREEDKRRASNSNIQKLK